MPAPAVAAPAARETIEDMARVVAIQLPHGGETLQQKRARVCELWFAETEEEEVMR